MSRTHDGMAHFAGTGPDGKTCRTCRYWRTHDTQRLAIVARPKPSTCARYESLLGKRGKAIPHDAHACKYYAAWGRHPMSPTAEGQTA